MEFLETFYTHLSHVINIDIKYISLFCNTIIAVIVFSLIKKIGKYIIKWLVKNERRNFIWNQNYKIVINIIEIIFMVFIWDSYIKDLMTLISFLSAAFAIALRDIILNFFCGMYIKIKKVFKIEDRIEIDGVKGDVMNLSSLEFNILEVNNKEENGQSTGVIITFPNSVIFSKPVKNYTKFFKYIWNEMIIKVPLTCDLVKTKQEIYRIINSNEVIKSIPKKMENQVTHTNENYRIYFNKYEPTLYTKVVDNYIELTVRYLIHPKKARYVESVIWNAILTSYKEGKIELYLST